MGQPRDKNDAPPDVVDDEDDDDDGDALFAAARYARRRSSAPTLLAMWWAPYLEQSAHRICGWLFPPRFSHLSPFRLPPLRSRDPRHAPRLFRRRA